MKTTVVPAQVTTVEDRIIGPLGFSQLMLLLVPIFSSAGMYALLPPFLSGAVYKYVLMTFIALLCVTLAVRIKSKILAYWLMIVLRYNLRPIYYLYNKNSLASRPRDEVAEDDARKTVNVPASQKQTSLPRLTIPDAAKAMAWIDSQPVALRFETTKKGALYVRYTEVEE